MRAANGELGPENAALTALVGPVSCLSSKAHTRLTRCFAPNPDLPAMTPSPDARTSTASTVRQVLADILGLPVETDALHDEANLFELGLDSLGVVRFVADIEAALRVQLPTEDLRAELFERLGRLIARIDERVAQEST